MSDALLTVLRDSRYIGQQAMREQAADEIERLRAALKPFAELGIEYPNCLPDDRLYTSIDDDLHWSDIYRATAAYQQSSPTRPDGTPCDPNLTSQAAFRKMNEDR